ncbi:facilitated trehalose transporter Tret1 isoform X3 [Bombus terrestris]|uniref:Facilitated trehalose transporter Tret1 isoform X3 n=1 Tax=Bombus terrestris TaxID=30195 RepID=A0A9C6W132_BOMTE|nr:facilitated trehalose transporter Tret1 isoform X3 [Bombus terrestris]
MSQRSTIRRRSFESENIYSAPSSVVRESPIPIDPVWRQCLAAGIATLTMVIVGTVYGWTKTSLDHLTSGTTDMPLTLTHDEYSWIVSLTVPGSIIGSLVGALLADRCGRKCCLLLCCTIFTLGWFIIYYATTVSSLYLARVIHGIGVGIAYTINPMFVSEIADIHIRGVLGSLISVNVYAGSMLTCVLGVWLTYESLLLVLAIGSFICILLNTYYPETPYFLVTKGKMKQADKSIAYYKGIVDPQIADIELRTLRAQARYDFYPQSRYALQEQSSSALQSESVFTVHSEFIREEHPQPTGEVRLQPSRELHSQSTSEIHRPSTSEIHRPSTSEIHRPSTSEIHRPSTSEIHRPSTSEIHRPSLSEALRSSTSEIHRPSTSEIHRSSLSEALRSSTSEIHPEPTSEIHAPTRSQLHLRSTRNLTTQASVRSRGSTDIHETDMDESKYSSLTKLELILQRSSRKALLIMLGLTMIQHLTGNPKATQYLETLLSQKSIVIHPYGATLVQIVCLISGAFTLSTVEFVGRRRLLFLSTTGSCLTLLILEVYQLLAEHKYDESDVSALPVVDLIINQIVFQIGLGTIPNVLLCELFPTKITGVVAAIILIFNCIVGFIMPKLYKVMTDDIGLELNYHIIVLSCFFAFMLVELWIPETKGKTFQEIEALLLGRKLNSSRVEVRSDDEMDTHNI